MPLAVEATPDDLQGRLSFGNAQARRFHKDARATLARTLQAEHRRTSPRRRAISPSSRCSPSTRSFRWRNMKQTKGRSRPRHHASK